MLTLRTSPALRLTLTNGRKVTISTPQPQAAILAIDSAAGVKSGQTIAEFAIVPSTTVEQVARHTTRDAG